VSLGANDFLDDIGQVWFACLFELFNQNLVVDISVGSDCRSVLFVQINRVRGHELVFVLTARVTSPVKSKNLAVAVQSCPVWPCQVWMLHNCTNCVRQIHWVLSLEHIQTSDKVFDQSVKLIFAELLVILFCYFPDYGFSCRFVFLLKVCMDCFVWLKQIGRRFYNPWLNFLLLSTKP
jgi:hypothetical protein